MTQILTMEYGDEFFQYALRIEKEWEATLPRFTDKELLKIFPEAKTVMSEKLSEWIEQKKEISESIKKKLIAIKSSESDDGTKLFWREWIKIDDGERLLEADGQISRLKRLIWLAKGKSPPRGVITQGQIEQARAIPLESLINQLFRRVGKQLVGLCPLHQEKHPSFYIYTDTNTCWCYGCNQGGDTIKFVRLLNGCSFREAIKYLIG